MHAHYFTGGTVDITAHEILEKGKIKEISEPSGGPWGGITVDKKFEEFLEKTFGTDFINKMQSEQRQEWFEFKCDFEKSKKYLTSDDKSSIKVSIPYWFSSKLKEHRQVKIGDVIRQSEHLSFTSSGHLVLKHQQSFELFEESVSAIVVHVKKLLAEITMYGLKYMLLVGGFGECKVLQNALHKEFARELTVIKPEEAQLAIIKGAVLFGHNPFQISSRVAKYTYGKRVTKIFQEGVHDNSRKEERDGKTLCSNCFEILVTKGEELTVGDSRSVKSSPVREGLSEVELVFYKTAKSDVQYVDDPAVEKLATAVLSSSSGTLGNQLETTITFGHTEFLIEARDIKSDKSIKVALEYFRHDQ